MFELLKTILSGRNQFASGGLMLMIIGGLGVYLRAVPLQIWASILRQTTMVITVKDDDAAFVWIKEWFQEQKFLNRIRFVDIDTTLRNERVALIPSPGEHWFWYRGRPFQVWFSRTEGNREYARRRMESFTFRTIGRNRQLLQEFVDDVLRCHVQRQGVQSYLYAYNDGWEYVQGYAPRLLESVILDRDEKESLLEDLARFRSAKKRYERLGVPYHRGYLFYGPPGTGKTSLISAVARHFGLSVYTINLTEFNDRTLLTAVNQVPANSVLLFEDIDCMRGPKARSSTNPSGADGLSSNAQDKESSRNGVTLSGLLNVLDGFQAPVGVVFAMTTNHIEALDEALLRPGRIDYKMYLGKASDQQKVALYRRFFPDSGEDEAKAFVEYSRSAETMAEFQGLLLALESDKELVRSAREHREDEIAV